MSGARPRRPGSAPGRASRPAGSRPTPAMPVAGSSTRRRITSSAWSIARSRTCFTQASESRDAEARRARSPRRAARRNRPPSSSRHRRRLRGVGELELDGVAGDQRSTSSAMLVLLEARLERAAHVAELVLRRDGEVGRDHHVDPAAEVEPEADARRRAATSAALRCSSVNQLPAATQPSSRITTSVGDHSGAPGHALSSPWSSRPALDAARGRASRGPSRARRDRRSARRRTSRSRRRGRRRWSRCGRPSGSVFSMLVVLPAASSAGAGSGAGRRSTMIAAIGNRKPIGSCAPPAWSATPSASRRSRSPAAYRDASRRRASALSVRSQGKPASSRPKWP